eukprot:COSAG02_NODE_51679_length_312_cov_1.211268_1_plen_35_part_10
MDATSLGQCVRAFEHSGTSSLSAFFDPVSIGPWVS